MKIKIKTANTFTPAGYAIYYAVLALMLTIMLTRSNPSVWQTLDPIGLQHAGSHASNFALSMVVLFVSGAMNMLAKISWTYILSLAAVLAIINLVVELFIPILNTPDIVDAIYGIGGIATALGLLYLLQRYGIKRAQ